MELIDKELLMKDFRDTITTISDTNDWVHMINRQQISFDKEKVAEQIEDLRRLATVEMEYVSLHDVLDIIEKGGVV